MLLERAVPTRAAAIAGLCAPSAGPRGHGAIETHDVL